MKTSLYFILLLLLVSNTLAYTDGFNSSLTELQNFSKADNFLEITQEVNSWIGYAFGSVLLLILGVIYFGVGLLFSNQFSKVFLFTTFSLTLSALLLKATQLVNDTAFYFCLAALVVSLFVIIIKRGE